MAHPADMSPPVAEIGLRRAGESGLAELVVCSLEPWDDIWRRNQFFVDALLKGNSELRILFVEPPSDVLFDLHTRRIPTLPRLRKLPPAGRLCTLRPLKLLPRRAGQLADRILLGQVRLAARAIGFSQPTLWVNDVTYAPLISQTSWPSVYDVTDDWLLAPSPPRELERLHRLDELALTEADEVVVCSPALASSRSATRSLSLIPNGVDVDHFRQPQPRPADLPPGPTAVYVGTLHDARLDVALVVELASRLTHLSILLIGPNSLEPPAQRALEALPNIVVAGPRPYQLVPAYLQHADVIIVPHNVSPFTESLDPIKAYECLAVDTPTVATPVAGFREHAKELNIADRAVFATRVGEVLDQPIRNARSAEPVSWDTRSYAFEDVLVRAASRERRNPAANR